MSATFLLGPTFVVKMKLAQIADKLR